MLFITNYFIVFLLAIFLIYIVGWIYVKLSFFSLPNKNEYVLTGIFLSFGFIFITSLLAVCYTNFKTLFSWSIFVLIFPFLLKLYKNQKLLLKFEINHFKAFKFLFLVSIPIFIYHFTIFSYQTKIPFFDFIFFGKVSTGILNEGLESFLIYNNNFIKLTNPSLYHFGDLWMNGFISKTSFLPEVHVLRFVTYPVFHVILFGITLSFFSIVFNKSNFVLCIYTFAVLYGIKLFLPLDNSFWKLVETYRGFPQAAFSFKQIPVYIISVLFLVLFKLNLKNKAFSILYFVPIFYATTIPAYGGIAVFFIFSPILFYLFKATEYKFDVKTNIIGLITIIFIYTYIKIVPVESIVEMKLKVYPIKTYIILFIETIIKVFIEHIIVVFLLVYVFITKKRLALLSPIILLSIIALLSAFIFFVLHDTQIPDLTQSITSISPVFLLLISLHLFPLVKENTRKYLVVVMVLFGLFNLSFSKLFPDLNKGGLTGIKQVFSNEFENKVNEYIRCTETKFYIATIRHNYMEQLKNNTLSKRWYFDNTNQFNFVLESQKIRPFLEVGPLIENQLEFYCQTSSNYPLCRYIEDNKKINGDVMYSILKKIKVNHIFVENYLKIDKKFSSHLQILFKDKNTGVCFCKI